MELYEYGKAALFILGGLVFAIGGIILNRILAPYNPYPQKLTTYECGEEPLGSAHVQFNMRFYVVGLIFLIFDVELLLLFPWAIVFADPYLVKQIPNWTLFTSIEAMIFILVLVLGLAYVWAKGNIDWIKPQQKIPPTPTQIPDSVYASFNAQNKETPSATV